MAISTAGEELGYTDRTSTNTITPMPIPQIDESPDSIDARNTLSWEDCQNGRIIFSKSGFPIQLKVGESVIMINTPAPRYSSDVGPFIELSSGVIRFLRDEDGWRMNYYALSNRES